MRPSTTVPSSVERQIREPQIEQLLVRQLGPVGGTSSRSDLAQVHSSGGKFRASVPDLRGLAVDGFELLTLADVDPRAALGLPLGLAQHFARHRRRVAFAEREEAQQIGDRIALGPAEVGVRRHAGAIAQIEQDRGDRIGNRRAARRQDLMAADVAAP